MAAASVRPGYELVDLRRLGALSLDALLEEETVAWRQLLHWNFQPSAGLVSRYVAMRSLDGVALLDAGRVIGYGYYVAEEQKGLIGDLYVCQAARHPEFESWLLDGILDVLLSPAGVRRVEAQLMMLDSRAQPSRPGETFPRSFLHAPLSHAGRLPERATPRLLYEHWSMRWLDDAADLIARVYRKHTDSRINDQYRSPAGARRFLQNIVVYPGCGQFQQPASWIALDSRSGQLAGVSLASMVADSVGHITQVCVAPELQGKGVGYELLRRSLTSLVLDGCREATLTVTSANTQAMQLYERLGFTVLREFQAMVWEA
jgi:ribosomal protein S18 acetylase RimI-like enzyme